MRLGGGKQDAMRNLAGPLAHAQRNARASGMLSRQAISERQGMAKLTEQEQAAVTALTKLLAKGLPTPQRSSAGGIASGLVRMRKEQLSADDVRAVLTRYDAQAVPLQNLVDARALIAVGEGLFSLGTASGEVPNSPAPEQDPAGAPAATPSKRGGAPAASAAQGEPSSGSAKPARKQIAKQPARGLARLSCVRKQTPELNDIRRQIIDLDPRLWINGWLLSTPEAYTRYERELRSLSHALEGSPTLGDGTLSLRELSYRVFADEKFLAIEADGRRLLRLMGLSDIVHARPAAKFELLSHIPKQHRHMCLVVSENLDPWVNMRNAMYLHGRKRLFGERVHGVVFGNGHLVSDPHKLLDLIATLEAEDVRVLYWGDLDRAGLEILSRVATIANERVSVEPFAAAYRAMLKRAMGRFPDPLANEETEQGGVAISGFDLLEPALKKREAAYLAAVLEGARLIPQEILTAEDL